LALLCASHTRTAAQLEPCCCCLPLHAHAAARAARHAHTRLCCDTCLPLMALLPCAARDGAVAGAKTPLSAVATRTSHTVAPRAATAAAAHAAVGSRAGALLCGSRQALQRARVCGPLHVPARSVRRGVAAPRAEATPEIGLLPPPEVKSFSRKALRRIEREGPRESDLRDEVGRIVKECIPRARPAPLPALPRAACVHSQNAPHPNPHPRRTAAARDASPPDWRSLQRLPFSEFMTALRAGRAASVEVWSDRDPGVYWPPPPFHQPFAGKRALVTLTDGSRAWAELPIPELEVWPGAACTLPAGSVCVCLLEKRPTPRRAHTFARCILTYGAACLSAAASQKVATAALVASEGAVPYSFHQPPGREGYTQLDLGLIAIGGGIFIFFSIYLGLVRKGGIPTDTIQAMEFGQSKAKSRKEGRTGVTFADVAGLDTVRDELAEVVAFLRDPKRFNTVGARPPRGLLLEGGPGTGKTLVAKAIAGEAGVPFYSMSGSEFVEVIVGVGAARVRDLFKRARVNAPCIIFVDEIDALGGRRAPAALRGNEEREQTLNQLLTEMDGFTADTGVIFVGATNRADLLDPALLRPGRFDRRVTVRKPDAAARAQALRIHTRERVPLAEDVDVEALAAALVGFSGAEVANVVNEAALAAVRRGAPSVSSVDFASAQDRVLLGVARSAAGMAPDDARRIALHEAGHALAAALLRDASPAAGLTPVERVSVQPRGDEWSRTVWVRDDEGAAPLPTRGALLARVRVMLAGRAAEAVALGGDASTLGAPDLQDAATLARRLVGDYGLAAHPGEAGLTTFVWDARFVGIMPARLAADVTTAPPRPVGAPAPRPPSAPQLARAEAAVEALLRAAHADNVALLRARLGALTALADALLARETVSGAEVDAILAAHPPAPGAQHDGLPARQPRLPAVV
jgi:ATP-dependent metalloprotease FtsH